MKVQQGLATSMGAQSISVHVATLLAAALLCALSLDQLTTTASAVTVGCAVSENSPSVNDAIDAAALIPGRESCCQSNGWPLGSHCHNYQTVGGAQIGICGTIHACDDCDKLAKLYYLLIETCATNGFGGSRVAGSVSDFSGSSQDLRLKLY